MILMDKLFSMNIIRPHREEGQVGQYQLIVIHFYQGANETSSELPQ